MDAAVVVGSSDHDVVSEQMVVAQGLGSSSDLEYRLRIAAKLDLRVHDPKLDLRSPALSVRVRER
jgi:hypothetical protein